MGAIFLAVGSSVVSAATAAAHGWHPYRYLAVNVPATHAVAAQRSVLVFTGSSYVRSVQRMPGRPSRRMLRAGWRPVHLPIVSQAQTTQ